MWNLTTCLANNLATHPNGQSVALVAIFVWQSLSY
jgi:hypothetical protein